MQHSFVSQTVTGLARQHGGTVHAYFEAAADLLHDDIVSADAAQLVEIAEAFYTLNKLILWYSKRHNAPTTG